MKKLLPALLLLLVAFASCKKDASPIAIVDRVADTTIASTQPPVQNVSVNGISPSTVTTGAVVTITGTNLGTSASGLTVYFENKLASILSVTPTEIKVVVPQTSSGLVTIQINGRMVSTSSPLLFTYYESTVSAPYVSGDVKLVSQADVDSFVKFNKGKKIKITGNLAIGLETVTTTINRSDITSVAELSNVITAVSGTISFSYTQISDAPFLNTITAAGGLSAYYCDFTSLHLSALQSFSGDISFTGLAKLTQLNINNLSTVNNLTIQSCQLLTDLSFLNSIQTAASVNLSTLSAVTAINMDNLTVVNTGGITIYLNSKLGSVSFKSLNRVTGRLYIVFCPQLSSLNFKALKSVSDRLTIFNTNVSELSGFGLIQTLGALNITSNPALSNLHGLEQLTTLTLPAITGVVHAAGGMSIGLSGLPAALGGVTIQSNANLSSLNGLQNITTIPVAYILSNKILNDFCPFKVSVKALSVLPDYSYTYYATSGFSSKRSTTALTLTGNGSYVTTPDALKAVAICR